MKSRKLETGVVYYAQKSLFKGHYGKGLEELSEVEQLRLLKKIHGLIVNHKKVYRIMKERGWLCRARPKKVPNIDQPYYVTENKLDRDF